MSKESPHTYEPSKAGDTPFLLRRLRRSNTVPFSMLSKRIPDLLKVEQPIVRGDSITVQSLVRSWSAATFGFTSSPALSSSIHEDAGEPWDCEEHRTSYDDVSDSPSFEIDSPTSEIGEKCDSIQVYEDVSPSRSMRSRSSTNSSTISWESESPRAWNSTSQGYSEYSSHDQSDSSVQIVDPQSTPNGGGIPWPLLDDNMDIFGIITPNEYFHHKSPEISGKRVRDVWGEGRGGSESSSLKGTARLRAMAPGPLDLSFTRKVLSSFRTLVIATADDADASGEAASRSPAEGQATDFFRLQTTGSIPSTPLLCNVSLPRTPLTPHFPFSPLLKPPNYDTLPEHLRQKLPDRPADIEINRRDMLDLLIN